MTGASDLESINDPIDAVIKQLGVIPTMVSRDGQHREDAVLAYHIDQIVLPLLEKARAGGQELAEVIDDVRRLFGPLAGKQKAGSPEAALTKSALSIVGRWEGLA